MSENGSDYYSDSNSESDSESEIKIEKNNLDKKINDYFFMNSIFKKKLINLIIQLNI